MQTLLKIGQKIRGRASTYSIVKELHRATDQGAVYLARDRNGAKCIVKSIRGHWRLENEAAVLKKYQTRSPFIRPLLDETTEPQDPPSIVLRHLDSDLETESNRQRLTRPEIKQVARSVLGALRVLHGDGKIHTDIKLDNIFVNVGQRPDQPRFSDIQLGDFGGVVPETSDFAQAGHAIGASYTRSPEAQLNQSWGCSTDIWSFGNAIMTLLYGGGYYLFNPSNEKISADDHKYEIMVLIRMHRFFGPFPDAFRDQCDEEATEIIDFVHSLGPPTKPFKRVTRLEIPPADRDFLLKIMKLNPRARPTAEELLGDEWFTDDSEDTRSPPL